MVAGKRIAVLFLILFSVGSAQEQGVDILQPPVPHSRSKNAEPVEVHVFGMSKCPDFTAFVKHFRLLYDELDPIAKLKVDFVVAANDSAPLGFESKHGETEVLGDIGELCVQKYFPDKFFDFLECTSKEYALIPVNLEPCALATGVDPLKLAECSAVEHHDLLVATQTATAAAGATWSPTIFIDGKFFCKFHDTCYEAQAFDLVDSICKAYKGTEELPYICRQVG